MERTNNCVNYFKTLNTVAFDPMTREEEAFPLAFAYTVHENIAIVEMFLALFFRPTDYHLSLIHI